MTAPVSHKLIVRDDGQMFVISGNPSTGYTCHHATLEHVSDHQRSWQAVTAAGEWVADAPSCGADFWGLLTCELPNGHDGEHQMTAMWAS